MFVSERYSLEDCLLYGDWQKIASTFNTTNFVSGRTIYYLNTQYTNDVSLEFKFKDTVPSLFLVGLGETDATSTAYAKMMFYNNNNTLNLFVNNGGVSISNPSKTVDTIFKITTTDLHSCSAYMDNVLKATHSTSSNYALNLRIDSFTATPVELEYLKVKPL